MSESKSNSNRRKFLKNASGLVLGSALFSLPKMNGSTNHLPNADVIPSHKYWPTIRTMFPLDSDVRFMNNGTMGIVPNSTLKEMEKSLEKTYERGRYGGGKAELVKSLSKFINAQEDEISLSHNVTEGNSIVCWGLPLKKDDEVVISDQEHVGNSLTWLNRAKVDGIKLKVIKILKSPEEIVDNFKKAITKKTRAITIPHVPCTTGQVNPIKEICRIAKEKGIYSIIDGAHGPGMTNIDVKDLGCDVYISCGHKWLLGPSGTGFFYVNKEVLNEVQALFVGAGAEPKDGWDINSPLSGYSDSAHRYYYGTQSAALYHGFVESINFINSIGKEKVVDRCKHLSDLVYKGLQQYTSELDILSQEKPEYRAGIVSFKFKKKDNKAFMDNLRKENTVIRYVPESGLNSLRISTHIYNLEDDVSYLLDSIKSYINGK